MSIETYTVDLWYQVMPNGDVITSDGTPRRLHDEHAKIAIENAKKHGREVTFRKPTEAEEGERVRW